jgi:hypothetical protein
MKSQLKIVILVIILLILIIISYFLYTNKETFTPSTSSSNIPTCTDYWNSEYKELQTIWNTLKSETKRITDEKLIVVKTSLSGGVDVYYKFDWTKANFGYTDKEDNIKKEPKFSKYNNNCKQTTPVSDAEDEEDEVCLDHFIEYFTSHGNQNLKDPNQNLIDKIDLRPKHKWKYLVERIYRYISFGTWCENNKNTCNIDCEGCDIDTKNACIKNYYKYADNKNYSRCKIDAQYHKPETDELEGVTDSTPSPTNQFTKYENNNWFIDNICKIRVRKDDDLLQNIMNCNSACDCGGDINAEKYCRKMNPSLCYYSGGNDHMEHKIYPSPYIDLPPDYKRKCNISENIKCDHMNSDDYYYKDYYNCLLTENLKKCDYKCNCTSNSNSNRIEAEDINPTLDDIIYQKKIENGSNEVSYDIVALVESYKKRYDGAVLPRKHFDNKYSTQINKAKKYISENLKTNFNKNLMDKCMGIPSAQFVNPSEIYVKPN